MKFIPNSLTQSLGRQILTAQKHSPRVLFVSGLVGVGVSTVLACRATLKLESTLTEFKNEVDSVKADHPARTDVDHRRDLAYVYVKNTYAIARLYAPAIIIGTASVAALTTSHVTLSRRNTSLTAAYAAVASSFEAYRDRVRKELGDDKELDIYHAVKTEQLMDPDGKLEEVKVADPNQWSPYARFFDEGSRCWEKNAELNLIFIKCQQAYLNNLLQARGHVFLNEAYDALGLDRSSAGQVVGWVISKDGDNYIDFGLYKAGNERFVNGWERNVILDFNVDGVIWDKI